MDPQMNLPLWTNRTDAESVTHFSEAIDAASIHNITLFLTAMACPFGNSIVVSAEHSLNPGDPAGWNAFGASPGASAPGNAAGVAGGIFGDTDEAIGPYVRFKAVVVVVTGGVNWSATAVLR